MTTSLLEALNDDRTVVDKARFVDYFVGDSLKSWWNETDTGTGTKTMNDAIDGGLTMTTGATSNNREILNFNAKRPFSQTASKFITVSKTVTSTSRAFLIGAGFNNDLSASTTDFGVVANDTGLSSYFSIDSADGSTRTQTGSTISRNLQRNETELTFLTSSMTLSINDSFAVTKTTNLPTQRIQPIIHLQALSASAVTGEISYLEAWNN